MSSLNVLMSFNYYFSWFCFIAILILDIALFTSIKFKMDRAAILLMLTLLVVAFLRMLSQQLINDEINSILVTLASFIQSWLIYFFVFEMMFIAAKL